MMTAPEFTEREREVCMLVALDMTANEIAASLEIHVSTTKTIIRNAARKIPGEQRARTRILLHFHKVGIAATPYVVLSEGTNALR